MVGSENYLMDIYPTENFEIPNETLKRYMIYIVTPIENVDIQFTKKVMRTYPVPSNPYLELCCFSSGRWSFSGPYNLTY